MFLILVGVGFPVDWVSSTNSGTVYDKDHKFEIREILSRKRLTSLDEYFVAKLTVDNVDFVSSGVSDSSVWELSTLGAWTSGTEANYFVRKAYFYLRLLIPLILQC